jgi:hypothetical protein
MPRSGGGLEPTVLYSEMSRWSSPLRLDRICERVRDMAPSIVQLVHGSLQS